MYPEPAISLIPKSCIFPGKNDLLVRLAQPFGSPSVEGKKKLFSISTKDSGYKTALSGEWLMTIQDSIPKPKPEYQIIPVLYSMGWYIPVWDII